MDVMRGEYWSTSIVEKKEGENSGFLTRNIGEES